ncbi:hypothetical protein BDV12DRAFT_206701 [Aspergillus spectabilis]
MNTATAVLLGTLNEDERLALLQASHKLRGALEVATETTMRLTTGGRLFYVQHGQLLIVQVFKPTALVTAIDMGLIDAAVKLTAERPEFTITEVAKATSADPLLIVRLMRILCGIGVFREVDVATFESTSLANAYVNGSPFRDIAIHLTSHAPLAALMPNYLAEKGYVSPNDTFDEPFHVRLQEALNTVMACNPGKRGQDWFEYYPVEERLQVHSPSDVLIVDVGGNSGDDLARFRKHLPSLQGRAVLQDQPVVIDRAQHNPEVIEAMDHGVLFPQPIIGAKAYYLRLVQHDWPDKQAKVILERLKDAMTADSVLLINETLVPESRVPLYDAWIDITIMGVFASINQTEAQFRGLLISVGLEVVKVWKPDVVVVAGSTNLFEAGLEQ